MGIERKNEGLDLPPARRPREGMESEAHTRDVERIVHRRKQLQRPRDILSRTTVLKNNYFAEM